MKTGFYPGCSLKGSSREYAESVVALARALYAGAELDHEIPLELYGAVAEVLVYILHLDAENKITK